MPPLTTAEKPIETPSEKSERPPLFGPEAKAMLLFNPKAGGTTEADRDKLIAAVKAAGIERYALVGAELISKRLLARAKNFDVVIVLGGDGTARAVAQLALRDGPPLVLLPGGTLNILPHALYGDRPWPEALSLALTQGKIKRLCGGRANNKRFFVAAIFGAPTLLARAREAVREGRLLTAVKRTNHFLKRAFATKITAKIDGQRARKTEAVGVLCPSFSGQLEGDCVEWVRLDARHLLDLARVSLRALGEGWRNDAAIEIARCTNGEIRSTGFIPAVLDGEPKTFMSHIRISYDRTGPRVIALEPEGA